MSVVSRGLPSSALVKILSFLPDERERIRATRTSKAFLSVRGSYESDTRGILWRRLRRISVRTGALIDQIASTAVYFMVATDETPTRAGFTIPTRRPRWPAATAAIREKISYSTLTTSSS